MEIPRLPPKPMLTTLTGGYRRTPVMQIGADIYCDTHCIIRELERRYPAPSFMPTADAGLLSCLSRWTERCAWLMQIPLPLIGYQTQQVMSVCIFHAQVTAWKPASLWHPLKGDSG